MFKYLLYQIEYRRWFFLALLVALGVHAAPTPAGLTPQSQSILGIVAMTVILVIAEPVPLPVLALLIVVLEVFFQVGPPAGVVRSFLSDSVIFIAGSLMLALAVVKQSLDKRILLLILRWAGGSIYWTVSILAVTAGLLASWMGEHAVAAVLLPVALVLIRFCREVEIPGMEQPLLMAVVYGCGLAAVGTPSGGVRNAIMLSYWEQLSGIRVSYPQWILFMYPLALVQILLVFLLLPRLYPLPRRHLLRAYARLRAEMGSRRALRVEDWLTIAILLVTLGLWIVFSRTYGLGPVALIGVLLCILTGVLNWEDINQDLNWGTVFLYASIISIGLWMSETGAADWIAGGLDHLLGFFHIEGGLPLVVVVSLVGMFAGSVLATGPAIAILGPIVLKQAGLHHASPLVLGMVLVASCSSANFTPTSSPACTIVYGSGMVERQEYVRVGAWLALLSLIVISLFATFYWPLVTEGL